MKEVKLMMVNEKNLENVSEENKKKSNNSKKMQKFTFKE